MARIEKKLINQVLWDAIDERMELIATQVMNDARSRCPVRKDDRGRRTIVALTPGGRYQLGRVSLSAKEIAQAAQAAGIDLGAVARERKRFVERRNKSRERRGLKPLRTRVELGIVTRRPRYRADEVQRETPMTIRELRATVGMHKNQKAQSIEKRRENAISTFEDKPGALRRSIHVANESSGKVIRYAVRATGNGERDYARYVEFPTVHTAAQPFLLPALKNNAKRIPQRLRGAVGTVR